MPLKQTIKEPTQRRFSTIGTSAYKILDRLTLNQRLCRLLKYNCRNPFDESLEDINGEDLIGKQICIVPKIFDDLPEKMSYVVAVFDKFVLEGENAEFKNITVRFDIACPYDEWKVEDESLRPYLIMEEIDKMFNQKPLAGIGNLHFLRSDPLTLSPQIGGYSMIYTTYEFN